MGVESFPRDKEEQQDPNEPFSNKEIELLNYLLNLVGAPEGLSEKIKNKEVARMELLKLSALDKKDKDYFKVRDAVAEELYKLTD